MVEANNADGIKALQEQLKALNFKVDVTGQIDRKTQIAFRAFMWDLQAVAAKNGQRDAAVNGIYDASSANAIAAGLKGGFKIPSMEDDTRFHRRAERAGKTDAEYALALYKAASVMGLARLDPAKLQDLRVAETETTGTSAKQNGVAGAVPGSDTTGRKERRDEGPQSGEPTAATKAGLPHSEFISIRKILRALRREEVKDDRNPESTPDGRKHFYMPGDSEAARFKAVPLTEPFNGHADRKIKLNYFDIRDELTRLNKEYGLQASPKEIEDAARSIMSTYGAKPPDVFAAASTRGPATSAPGIVSTESAPPRLLPAIPKGPGRA